MEEFAGAAPARMAQRLFSGWLFPGLRGVLFTGCVLVAAGCASPLPEEPRLFQPAAAELPSVAAPAVREPLVPAPEPPIASPVRQQASGEAPVPPKPRPAAKSVPLERIPVTGSIARPLPPRGEAAESAAIVRLSRAELAPVKGKRAPAAPAMAMAEPSEVLLMNAAGAPASRETAKPEAAVYDGSTAYYVPLRMVEGKVSMVHLWLDRKTAVADLQQELAGYLQQMVERIRAKSGREPAPEFAAPAVAGIEGKTVRIGDTMIAHLRGGNDFDIDPKEPVTQSLKGENRARWNWRVTPTRASEDGVPLILDVWIDPGHGRQLIESFHEQVYVTARPRTWYEIFQELDKWLVLLGLSGVGGVAAWLWKKLVRARGGHDRQADSSG